VEGQGNRLKEESRSFLKKRRRPPGGNQKTFAYWARAYGQSEGIKVFCFFFSKKKTFLWLACLHPLPLVVGRSTAPGQKLHTAYEQA